MGVVVQFSYGDWSALFPEFNNLANAQITGPVLVLAQQYHRNDGGGPITDTDSQTQLLNLMVAHIAQLLYGSVTNPANELTGIGRMSNASEGTVSAGFEYMPLTGTSAWYMLTKYGALYWQLARPFFRGRYRANQRLTNIPNMGSGWLP